MKNTWVILLVFCAIFVSCKSNGPTAHELLVQSQSALESEDYARALIDASEALERNTDDTVKAQANVIIAQVHYIAGNRESALIFAHEALKYDNQNHGAREILAHADTVSSLLPDGRIAAMLYGNLYEYERVRTAEALRRYHRNMMSGGILVLVLGVLLAAVAYSRWSQRRKIHEMQQRLMEVVAELSATREQTRTKVSQLFYENFDSLERISNMLIDTQLSKNKTDAVIKQLEQIVNDYRSPHFLKRLETALNSIYDDIFVKLRRDVPSITDTELTIALYSATGLSSRVVCMMLNCSASSLYNRKYRLRRHIISETIPSERQQQYLRVIFNSL